MGEDGIMVDDSSAGAGSRAGGIYKDINGGFYIVWDGAGGNYRVQHIDLNGNFDWPDYTGTVATLFFNQTYTKAVTIDSNGNLVIYWKHGASNAPLYGQLINSN